MCNNFLTEKNNYQRVEDKFGQRLNKPVDNFNHLIDEMRYAVEDYTQEKIKVKIFKSIF